ncbi:MAG: hypothetical protein M3Z04_03995 [Chloroflexota bacterium]|nr:hypothetical protein [Chloroflexota bacterium]
MAQIVGWEQVSGVGQIKAEAYTDLETRFNDSKRSGRPLPRPGTRVRLQIAPHDAVDRYAAVADEFFAKILGMDYTQILGSPALLVIQRNGLPEMGGPLNRPLPAIHRHHQKRRRTKY